MYKNPQLHNTLVLLKQTAKKQKAPVWKAVALQLESPSRQAVQVNIGKLEVFAGKETLLIPGKVLAGGILTKKVQVVAVSASPSAQKKILAAGGSFKTLEQELSTNAAGKGLRILK
jgi:large subunit ribosomal protein L18e